MIKKLLSSLVRIFVPTTEPQEKPVATPIPTAVPPSKNLSATETETVLRPLVSELKKALREKYPFSQFQTVFLSFFLKKEWRTSFLSRKSNIFTARNGKEPHVCTFDSFFHIFGQVCSKYYPKRSSFAKFLLTGSWRTRD